MMPDYESLTAAITAADLSAWASPSASVADTTRALKAFLDHKKQELLAPVNGLLELSAMLLKDAREREQEAFLNDQEKIFASGQHLLTMVQEMLEPNRCAADLADLSKRVRHDLRTPLTHIIGLCELWLEDADDLLLQGFAGDLRSMLRLCQQLLAGIDEMLSFTKSVSDPDINLEEFLAVLPDGAAAGAESGQAGGDTGAILVVDDNEINRDLLLRRLSREGHTVTLAGDGRQALALLQQHTFDLVLLDILMPEMNGFQVLEQLKAHPSWQHIPVILISAFTELDSIVRGIEMGAEDYLTKPFSPVLLRARIGACLEKKRLRDREVRYLEQIQQEQQRTDELLRVILPAEIVVELKETNRVKPRRFENVAVLFCDIVGFTPFCDANQPEEVVAHLQQLIEDWEEIAVRHGVQKIKTIGDAFMAAAGLLQKTQDHPVLHCVRCGLAMIAACRQLPTHWNIRVGIHAGPVVAGVIGKRQYLFDLWGDTVNTAARMESHGIPGAVVLSGSAWQQIADRAEGEVRGMVPIKGKGQMEMVRFERFRF